MLVKSVLNLHIFSRVLHAAIAKKNRNGWCKRSLERKICNKYRKHRKIHVSFQLSRQTRPILAVLNFFSVLLKYPAFDCGFLGKKSTKLEFLQIIYSIRTKMLIDI